MCERDWPCSTKVDTLLKVSHSDSLISQLVFSIFKCSRIDERYQKYCPVGFSPSVLLFDQQVAECTRIIAQPSSYAERIKREKMRKLSVLHISGQALIISPYFGCYCCVCVCVYQPLSANSFAVIRRHHHAACCCPFSGLVQLIVTTQVAAHQSPPHHVRLLQTRCLQHPTGTTSPPPCTQGGERCHSCIVLICFAA